MTRRRGFLAWSAVLAAVVGLAGPNTRWSAGAEAPPGGTGLLDPPLPALDQDRLGGMWFRQMEPLRALAFSPDGRTLAAAGASQVIHLWDVESGKESGQILNPEIGCWSVAFSADGKRLACTWEGNGVGVHDFATGNLIWRAQGHKDFESHAIAFSPDGRLVAVPDGRVPMSGPEETVRIRDAATGEVKKTLVYSAATGSNVASVAFSPDSQWLAAGGWRGGVKLWDVASGKEVRALAEPRAWIRSVAFSPDGKLLAGGGSRGSIWVWETATGKPAGRLEVPDEDDVSWIAFAPGGSRLVAAGYDRQVRIWDLARQQEESRFPLRGRFRDNAVVVALAPDGWIAEASARFGAVRVYDLATGLAVPADADPETLWAALGEPDILKARLAARALADRPAPTLGLLGERLRPAAATDTRGFDPLLTGLDDNRFDSRELAEAALRRIGAPAEPALRKLLAGKFSAEAQARAERLLEGIKPPGFLPADAELRRSLHALRVLGEIGTPAARALLERIAAGAPEAPQTGGAKAMLERLRGR